ncbi:polysaccharide deacetylase family protein [Paenibacillus sp. NPDC057967]|uniref:polysaccharide deacetylase family protein n=1 Tax=Paenibacillus sp. NPDC057967 TaxID=3346293 RepID=UPI0036DDC6EE
MPTLKTLLKIVFSVTLATGSLAGVGSSASASSVSEISTWILEPAKQQLTNPQTKQKQSTVRQKNKSTKPNQNRTKSKKVNRSGKRNSKRANKRNDDMSWVNMQNKYPGTFVMSGSRDKRNVSLTFDDAPDPRVTPEILDTLSQYHIRATFFIVGDRAAKHPELVKRIMREGHVIGNHSYNHAVLSKLPLAQFQQQIWKTDGIIKRIVGVSPRLVRPPYGEMKPQQIAWGKENGFTVVNWDVDSEDWRNNPSSARVLANIKKTLQPGSIILQHAGGGDRQDLSGTIHALPVLIEMLQGKGYNIVTLPELLGRKAYR